ncbi:DUF2142 domain-containing protein [Bifidobacterium sp. ESL0763]|uniref:DUF2142 domain-containing protein n=1 Tax=Bifidobacterium sp. ESL0763 TaxID=2983227 RepID=UPI0023F719A3|nr:DUF2142 domain-containing protein [Bifidobacterium sp. ESL0763]MDF7663896.1 DUF2142 domain-containing protein [Bifidobacterium sp. ESL0763]
MGAPKQEQAQAQAATRQRSRTKTEPQEQAHTNGNDAEPSKGTSSKAMWAKRIALLRRLMPLVTVLLALLIGSWGMLRTPAGYTPDVWPHTYRISAIMNGSKTHHVDSQIESSAGNENVGGKVSWKWIDYSLEHADVTTLRQDTVDVSDARGEDAPFNNTATNSPVVYAPQIIGFGIGSLFNLSARVTYYLTEAVTLLICSLFLGLAVALLPEWRIVVGLLIPFLNLHCFIFPAELFAISADPFTQVMSTLFACMLYRAFKRRISALGGVGLGVVGVVLAMCKFIYAPIVVLVLLVPFWQKGLAAREANAGDAVPGSRDDGDGHNRIAMAAKGLRAPVPFKACLAIMVVAVVCALGWLAYWMTSNGWYTNAPVVVSYETMVARKHAILASPSGFLNALGAIIYAIVHVQTLGGFSRKAAALILVLLALLFVVMVVATCMRRMRARELVFIWLSYLMPVGIMLLTYLALYLQYTPAGMAGVNGMQYRYFLPMAPLWMLCGLTCLRALARPSGKHSPVSEPAEATK